MNVPFDNVGKLWGVWYVIGSEYNATDVSTNADACTQLNWVPDDATNPMTNLSYLGKCCSLKSAALSTTAFWTCPMCD